MQPDLSQFKNGELPDGFIIDEPDLLDPNATFRERLMARFSPIDVVTVHNPSKNVYKWTFMPEHNELQVPDGQRTGFHTYRKKPEQYQINPDETLPLIGANAYVMIEGLTKVLIIDEVNAALALDKDSKKKSNAFLQPEVQERYIDLIVTSHNDPISLSKANNQSLLVDSEEDSLEADLGLTESPRRGRPKATA